MPCGVKVAVDDAVLARGLGRGHARNHHLRRHGTPSRRRHRERLGVARAILEVFNYPSHHHVPKARLAIHRRHRREVGEEQFLVEGILGLRGTRLAQKVAVDHGRVGTTVRERVVGAFRN